MKAQQKTIIEQPKKFYKRYSGLLYILIGIIIGFGIKTVITYANNSKDYGNTNVELSIRPTDTKKSILTNPIVSSEETQNLIFTVLKPFDQKIRDYVRNIYKSDRKFKLSLYFRDLNNGSWFSINEKEEYELASLGKVFAMIITYKLAQRDTTILNKNIVVSFKLNKSPNNDPEDVKHIQTKLKIGDAYSIEELIRCMIVDSDNTALALLLNFLESDYKESCMSVFEDLNINYDKKAFTSNSYVNVRDFSRILRTLYNSTFLNEEFSNKSLDLLSQTTYKTGFRNSIPPNIKIAMKYGIKVEESIQDQIYPPLLHEAGIFYYPGKPYLLCIMTKGKREEESGKIIEEISRMIYNEVDRQMQKIPLSLRDRDKQQ